MAKIMLVCSYAESLLSFRQELLSMLAQSNDVLVAAPDFSAEHRKTLTGMGITCCEIALYRTGLNPWKDFKTIVSLYQLCQQQRPDYILSYTAKPVIYGSIAAKLAGVSHIYSMITGLGSYFIYKDKKSCFIKSIMTRLYRLALHRNQGVLFQNPDDRAEFEQLGLLSKKQRVTIIAGSGVNLKKFSPGLFKTQASMGPNAQSSMTFLMIARLIKDKGVLEYVEAAKQLKQRYPQVQFQLAGWIDDKSQAITQAQLQQWVENDWIVYLGHLKSVQAALSQANVYVLPSYREGTPKTVLEAMAMGLPIVTTDVPGCRETVEHHGNGFLVPVQNSEALKEAMEAYIRQPDILTTMGSHSRQLAEQKYDVEKVNQTIMRFMGITQKATICSG